MPQKSQTSVIDGSYGPLANSKLYVKGKEVTDFVSICQSY